MIDKSKELVLCLDGKQTGKGLKDTFEGDVDLWGLEGPPSLKESHAEINREITYYDMLALKLTDNDGCCEESMKTLKYGIQITSHKIKNLQEAIVRHEILRNSFNKKIKATPNVGSKYVYAFSEIEAFIGRARKIIQQLLEINVRWCKVMAEINRNENYFRTETSMTLDDLQNGLILLSPDILKTLYGDDFLENNSDLVKQRTEEWHALRNSSKFRQALCMML